MLKTPTDLVRHALNGPTMGTRWAVQFFAPAGTDPAPIGGALADAVAIVDCQMSTWKPDSDLMRISRAPVGEWVAVPAELIDVLVKGTEIGRLSDGAFDIGMGDVVTAWGFGPQEADAQAMRAALGQNRPPAHDVLDLDVGALRVCKRAPLTLDLSGIAKGYAVDQMRAVLQRFDIVNALVSLDGEMRAIGQRSPDRPWAVAVERPDFDTRAPLSILELFDCAVATSGDYRHWVELGSRRLSHTMDPDRGGPLKGSPASVTVLAGTCMEADAWATALMVQGALEGAKTARRLTLNALFVERDGGKFRQTRVGSLLTG